MYMFFTHTSPLWMKQNVSTRLALPARMLFISVPVSTMPAVYWSMRTKSNFALLFCMFTRLLVTSFLFFILNY